MPFKPILIYILLMIIVALVVMTLHDISRAADYQQNYLPHIEGGNAAWTPTAAPPYEPTPTDGAWICLPPPCPTETPEG